MVQDKLWCLVLVNEKDWRFSDAGGIQFSLCSYYDKSVLRSLLVSGAGNRGAVDVSVLFLVLMLQY